MKTGDAPALLRINLTYFVVALDSHVCLMTAVIPETTKIELTLPEIPVALVARFAQFAPSLEANVLTVTLEVFVFLVWIE